MSLGSLLWLGHHAGAVLFANFFWGVKLRDSVCETFFHFFASCSALFAPLRGEG